MERFNNNNLMLPYSTGGWRVWAALLLLSGASAKESRGDEMLCDGKRKHDLLGIWVL